MANQLISGLNIVSTAPGGTVGGFYTSTKTRSLVGAKAWLTKPDGTSPLEVQVVATIPGGYTLREVVRDSNGREQQTTRLPDLSGYDVASVLYVVPQDIPTGTRETADVTSGQNGRYIDGVSMSADITPAVSLIVDGCHGGSIQLIWTGLPVGGFVVEASNDDNDYAGVTDNWTDVSSLASPALPELTAAPGGALILLSNISFKYLRVRYVFVSGTGALTAIVLMKE